MSFHGSRKNKDAYKISTEPISVPRRKQVADTREDIVESEEKKSSFDRSVFGSNTVSSRSAEGDLQLHAEQRGAGSSWARGKGDVVDDESTENILSKRMGRTKAGDSPLQQSFPGLQAEDGVEYEHIPESLKRSFQSQMAQMADLIGANDRLNEQNKMLKNNRGVKIDHEQFLVWNNKIDDLRFALEESQQSEAMLREENSLRLERINELEEELRRLRRMKGEALDEVRRSAGSTFRRSTSDLRVALRSSMN